MFLWMSFSPSAISSPPYASDPGDKGTDWKKRAFNDEEKRHPHQYGPRPCGGQRCACKCPEQRRHRRAAIDVFETEPPIKKEHPLLNAKNVIATPHIAFATKEALVKRAVIVFDNVAKWLRVMFRML